MFLVAEFMIFDFKSMIQKLTKCCMNWGIHLSCFSSTSLWKIPIIKERSFTILRTITLYTEGHVRYIKWIASTNVILIYISVNKQGEKQGSVSIKAEDIAIGSLTVFDPDLWYIIFQLLNQFLLFINLCCKFCYLLFCCIQQRCFLRKFDLKMVKQHLINDSNSNDTCK